MRNAAPILALLFCACSANPPPPSTLDDFLALSAQDVARRGIESASGLDPVDEWALLLATKRGHSEPGGAASDRPLFVNHLETLTVADARTLARFDGGRIFLGSLRGLDAAAAGALAVGRHELFLDGLESLGRDTARALVEGAPRRLSLKGLRTLDAATATELARLDGSLHLGGLADPESEVLEALAQWAGWGEQVILSLGVVDPTPEQIRCFRDCKGWGLGFPAITDLTPNAARAFATIRRPYLSFNGIRTLRESTAEEIARWQAKFLVLDRFEGGGPAIIEHLRRGCAALSIRSAR